MSSMRDKWQTMSPAIEPPTPALKVIGRKTGWRALDLSGLWRYKKLFHFLVTRGGKVRQP